MEPANSPPERPERKRPRRNSRSLVLMLVVAVSAGAGISRMQRAVESPDATGQSSSKAQTAGRANESAEKSESEATSLSVEPTESPLTNSQVAKSESAGKPTAHREPNVAVPESVSDGDLKTQMLGTWEDDYKGHRTLTLNADGTGTMVVELDGLAATLFAEKLTFQEEWSVTDGKVTMKATGGEPSGKVSLVLSLHGDSSTQRIVEVTDDRMILVEEPSETRFEWRRVSDSASPKN